MKKMALLAIVCFLTYDLFAQREIKFVNGDFETKSEFKCTAVQGNAWKASGVTIYAEVENMDQFDLENSGFKSGAGINGSTALKITSKNTIGKAYGFQMALDKMNVSELKHGKYMLTFMVKAKEETDNTPFWAGIRNDSGDVIGKGPVKNFEGMSKEYKEQLYYINIGRKDEWIRFTMGMAKYDNTYLLDEFMLYGPI